MGMDMDAKTYLAGIPELAPLMDAADRIHVRSVETDLPLRTLVVRVLSYTPGWMLGLYRLRAVLVRLLGTRQEGMPGRVALEPEEVSFTPGDPAAFFTVAAAEEGLFWAASARDGIIEGTLAVARESVPGGPDRCHVLTLARFVRPAGRVYFTIITPFHHLVVAGMLRHALRG